MEDGRKGKTRMTKGSIWPHLYIGITLALAWLYTAFILNDPANRLDFFALIMLIPAPVALITSFWQRQSIKHLIRPLFGCFRLSSYLFSIIYPLVLIGACGLAAWVTQLADYNGERLSALTDVPGPGKLLIGVVLIFGEEYGWRGYLLPELARQRGPVSGTIYVGIVWALFHAPLMYGLAKIFHIGHPVMVSAIQGLAVFVFSFPIAYAFLRTGSIIPPIFMHLIWNIYNPAVLGSLYQGQPGIFEGNLLLINGEAVMGVLLGSLFMIWFIRHRSKIAT